jgi:putative endonuclease
MYYIYILKSHKDNNFYIGQTCNIENRLHKHNNGLVKSTKYRRPLKLIYSEEYKSLKEARYRELEIKAIKAITLLKS